ncbi:MAG: bifunctional diaminohydroxyphosphoribosylaminopyrimidine deaminase/5-amino-6-(5-phosphoribosylamino)uracil reductase RibD [Nitrosomonas sp.]|nr:bifunctional diaminohydroxyphosphoribosylaminopyrimidine deaminase/5-amino-6-(5-phosphoribosylamino)uracil reductase RibD [Nitrosomonas sp.]
MLFSQTDYSWMTYALRLAERGLYTTSPNPRVGCVIVKDGRVVGSGWHERAGAPHAEINALHTAGPLASGATAYVTLEPCGHHGRTPPCTLALIEAGVRRVIIAMLDPNPKVNGQGAGQLRAAGIDVQVGLLTAQAQALNIGFITRMQLNRPWVRMKFAASLDGKTALRNGQSQWITCEAARRDGHKWRARSCAILTGIGSVKADDSQLNVRHVETTRQPVRVVVDTCLELPLQAKILTGNGGRTWVFTATTDQRKIQTLQQAGASVMVVPERAGKVDLHAVMTKLAELEINELLVEAGARLNGALMTNGLADEVLLYFAPMLLGDKANGMLALGELTSLSERVELKNPDWRQIGKDMRFMATLIKKRV